MDSTLTLVIVVTVIASLNGWAPSYTLVAACCGLCLRQTLRVPSCARALAPMPPPPYHSFAAARVPGARMNMAGLDGSTNTRPTPCDSERLLTRLLHLMLGSRVALMTASGQQAGGGQAGTGQAARRQLARAALLPHHLRKQHGELMLAHERFRAHGDLMAVCMAAAEAGQAQVRGLVGGLHLRGCVRGLDGRVDGPISATVEARHAGHSRDREARRGLTRGPGLCSCGLLTTSILP